MPRKEVHDSFEMLILGRISGMSELMDAPSRLLHGHHRILYHDPIQMGFLAINLGGNIEENLIAGFIHIMLDDMLSESKQFIRKIGKANKKEKLPNNFEILSQFMDFTFGKKKKKW